MSTKCIRYSSNLANTLVTECCFQYYANHLRVESYIIHFLVIKRDFLYRSKQEGLHLAKMQNNILRGSFLNNQNKKNYLPTLELVIFPRFKDLQLKSQLMKRKY